MDTKSGVYGKYKVEKADGTLIDPNAVYFVLRIDKDKYARKALAQYIRSLIKDGKYDEPLTQDLIKLSVLVNPEMVHDPECKKNVQEMITRELSS